MKKKSIKIIVTVTLSFVIGYFITIGINGLIQTKSVVKQSESVQTFSQEARLLAAFYSEPVLNDQNGEVPSNDDFTVSIGELYAGDDAEDSIRFFASQMKQLDVAANVLPLFPEDDLLENKPEADSAITAEPVDDETDANVEDDIDENPDRADFDEDDDETGEPIPLVGVFGVEDWYTKIELPVTSEYVIAKVNEAVNVREGPSTSTDIVGKLKVKNYGKILERGEEWTKIESGKVTGYVNNSYLYMDEAAVELFNEWDALQVEVKASKLNIRTQPNTSCEILAQATNGDSFTWLPERSVDGWFAIQYDDDTVAYVSDQYADSVVALNTAITIEEEEARIRAEKYAKALEQSKKNPPSQVNRAPMEFTDEELYLMAAVIAMEALSESYEGKLAVANVIINRILDGYWGDTLNDVIYAPGQFSGANEGRVQAYWDKVTESCKRAAVEAAAGNNNIGDYLFFISLRKADYEKYTKYYVLGGHCFYSRKW